MTLDELIKKLEEYIKVDSREEEAWLETQNSKKLIADFVAQELLAVNVPDAYPIGDISAKMKGDIRLTNMRNDKWRSALRSRAEEIQKDL